MTNNTSGLSGSLTDIQECDRERLHLIASIQSQGCLLLFTWPDQRVQSATENVKDFINLNHHDVLGAKLEHIFEKTLVDEIGAIVAAYPWKGLQGRQFSFKRDSYIFECFIFYSEGLFGLEIEKHLVSASETDVQKREIEQRHKEFVAELGKGNDLYAMASVLCKSIREITGIDRAMVYRFLPVTWHGEVIAEDRIMGAHSFMGHRFPSSDIPKPARDLYLRNGVRFIADSSGETSLLEPIKNPLNQQIVDLRDSRLRAVSKIHLEYLRNMGVKSSLSFAIKVKGELWGLVACHHLKPFTFTQTQRNACDLIVQTFSAYGPLLEVLNSHRERVSFEAQLRSFTEGLRASDDPLNFLFRQHQSVSEIFDVVGMCFVSKERVDVAGLTPLSRDLKNIGLAVLERMQGERRQVLALTNIAAEFKEFSDELQLVSGALAIQIPDFDGVLIFFRPELIKNIVWGGDPRKQLEKKNFQGVINPRASFEAWEEVVRHNSKDWKPYELDGAVFLRNFGMFRRRLS